jgi:DNA-directed RNA polymerase subunit RPC12/RpoP
MEKLYTCVACAQRFKILSRPDNLVYKQHEVEMNVECPFCSKTNAVVWPQDESLPLVRTVDGQPSQNQRWVEIQILRTAKELIAGRLGVIAASRELNRFRHDVEPQVADVLLTFAGIDSETDALPVGDVREEWSPDALTRKDREITEAEDLYRNSAINAASELIRLLETRS